MPSTTLTRSDIEVVLRRKIQRPTYRKRFLQSPRTEIEYQLGAPLPDDLNITVLEEGPNLFYFVVPYEIPTGCELSDMELEQVAGGKHDTYNNTGTGGGEGDGESAKN
jgi:hypothetical protein